MSIRLLSICMCVSVWLFLLGAFARLRAMLLPYWRLYAWLLSYLCLIRLCCAIAIPPPRLVSLPFHPRHLRIEPVNCLLVLTAIWIRPWKVAIKISNFIFMPWQRAAICMLQAAFFYPPRFFFGSRNFHLTQASSPLYRCDRYFLVASVCVHHGLLLLVLVCVSSAGIKSLKTAHSSKMSMCTYLCMCKCPRACLSMPSVLAMTTTLSAALGRCVSSIRMWQFSVWHAHLIRCFFVFFAFSAPFVFAFGQIDACNKFQLWSITAFLTVFCASLKLCVNFNRKIFFSIDLSPHYFL